MSMLNRVSCNILKLYRYQRYLIEVDIDIRIVMLTFNIIIKPAVSKYTYFYCKIAVELIHGKYQPVLHLLFLN